jgi:putative methyltransferase (TIGR04325 family)
VTLGAQLRRAASGVAMPVCDFVESFRSPFRGVYRTFQQASRAIPKGRKSGRDHVEVAEMYEPYMEKVRLSDYPALLWMSRALEPGCRVFDLGGHVGLAYYAFSRYLCYPPGLRWTVYDLPEIIRKGEQLARRRNAYSLAFTQDLRGAEGCDIFHAAGSLQCVDVDLSTIVGRLQKKPRHVLINRLPAYDGASYYTIQDIGPVMIPYRVFNKRETIRTMEDSGYELIDSWEIREASCGSGVVPFHPARSFEGYCGWYFVLRGESRV